MSTTYWTPGLQAAHSPKPRAVAPATAPARPGRRARFIPDKEPRPECLKPYPWESADIRTLTQLAQLSGQTVEALLYARNSFRKYAPHTARREETARARAELARRNARVPPIRPDDEACDDDLPF